VVVVVVVVVVEGRDSPFKIAVQCNECTVRVDWHILKVFICERRGHRFERAPFLEGAIFGGKK
jgi:hypothetical protein